MATGNEACAERSCNFWMEVFSFESCQCVTPIAKCFNDCPRGRTLHPYDAQCRCIRDERASTLTARLVDDWRRGIDMPCGSMQRSAKTGNCVIGYDPRRPLPTNPADEQMPWAGPRTDSSEDEDEVPKCPQGWEWRSEVRRCKPIRSTADEDSCGRG